MRSCKQQFYTTLGRRAFAWQCSSIKGTVGVWRWFCALLLIAATSACGNNTGPRLSDASTVPPTASSVAESPAITQTPIAPAQSPTTDPRPSPPAPVLSPTSTQTPRPNPAPTPTPRTVTQADNNTAIQLHVNDTVLLSLGDDLKWSAQVGDEAILSVVPNVKLPVGAQGLYRATLAGATTLMATGRPACTGTGTPCPAFIIPFRVAVTVVP